MTALLLASEGPDDNVSKSSLVLAPYSFLQRRSVPALRDRLGDASGDRSPPRKRRRSDAGSGGSLPSSLLCGHSHPADDESSGEDLAPQFSQVPPAVDDPSRVLAEHEAELDHLQIIVLKLLSKLKREERISIWEKLRGHTSGGEFVHGRRATGSFRPQGVAEDIRACSDK